MELTTTGLGPTGTRRKLDSWLVPALAVVALAIAGCGSSSSGNLSSITPPSATQTCDNANPQNCGEVLIGLTDADGDFMSYTVDVESLTLTSSDGKTVETLPNSTRIDFAQLVDLTEFLTVATVPPGVYVSGSISLDYTDAKVFVDVAGDAVQADIVDTNGDPMSNATLDIVLDNANRLVVTRGLPSLLTLDFDLDASHTVDATQSPPVATADLFIVAEIDPVDTKERRVRGPLLSVNLDASSYTVAIRPFLGMLSHDFGRAKVNTDSATTFEVNGEMFVGQDGLIALDTAGFGTPTIAFGTVNVPAREFNAEIVLAGSSVPWFDVDAVRGNVIARNGDVLTVKGATISRRIGDFYFHNVVTVLVGPNTSVTKVGDSAMDLDKDSISVGQRIVAIGDLSQDALTSDAILDASNGRVRMHVTHVAGSLNSFVPGQIEMTGRHIDRKRIGIFDWTGTGITPDNDVDPDAMEIASGNLSADNILPGTPIVVFGFFKDFGTAPPDFEGRTLVDCATSRAKLGIGWMAPGTAAPFTMISTSSIVLDLANPEIGERHHLKQCGVITDLLSLPASPSIEPAGGPGVYAIKQGNTISIHSDFGNFVNDLTLRLDGATFVRSMHAAGGYAADSNVFSARKLYVHLN